MNPSGSIAIRENENKTSKSRGAVSIYKTSHPAEERRVEHPFSFLNLSAMKRPKHSNAA
jgi:hypothetical protein